jgi:translation initiation factor 3 subunit H
VVISSLALLQLAKEWQRATMASAAKRSGQRSVDGLFAEASCTGQLVGYMEVEQPTELAADAPSGEAPLSSKDVLYITSAFSAPRLSMMTGGRLAQGGGSIALPASAVASQMQQRANYLWERSRLLREVSSESLVVGWFCAADSGQLASFVNAEWTETQFQYQFWLKNAVCVVFDPLRQHSSGTLGIRVVRLSDAFMREYSKLIDYRSGGGSNSNKASVVLQAFGRGGGRVAAGSTFVTETLRDLGLCSQTMIEDVPFTVQASALAEQYLAWSMLQRPVGTEPRGSASPLIRTDPDIQRLSLRRDGALVEQTANGLVQGLDEITREQSRYQHFLRNHIRIQNQQHEWLRKRRAENEQRRQQGQELLPEEPLPPHLTTYHEPSRLEPMMVFRDLSETLRDLELVIGGRCEKEVVLESLKEV